jgi:Bacterial protein of unknown function (DUF937)
MATNLVSQIVEALGPTIVARIASSLGLDQSTTQKAINAAVPGLLAALISLVSKPQGATKLSDAVAKQPAGVLSFSCPPFAVLNDLGRGRFEDMTLKLICPLWVISGHECDAQGCLLLGH